MTYRATIPVADGTSGVGCAITLILLVRDEAGCVAEVVAECDAVLAVMGEAYEIVVSEAGSVDGSRDLIRELPSRFPRVRPVFSEKAGYARQLRAGFLAARGLRAVLYLDGDGQYDAREIPAMIGKLREGQVVSALRIAGDGARTAEEGARTAGEGARAVGDSARGPAGLSGSRPGSAPSRAARFPVPLYRAALSRMGRFLVRAVLGLVDPDPATGFKALDPRFLKDLRPEVACGPLGSAEVLIRARRQGLRVAHHEVVLAPRRAGRSKMTGPRGLLAALVDLGRLFLWRLAGFPAAGRPGLVLDRRRRRP